MTEATEDIRRARVKRIVLIALALVALTLAGMWLYKRITHVHLDDARVDGEVVTLSSQVSGQVTELPVVQGDEVKAGQLLARIDARDAAVAREMLLAKMRTIEMQMEVADAQGTQADDETMGKSRSEASRLTAAEAELASADVQLAQAKSEYERAQQLTAQQWLSPQALERANADYKRAQETQRKAVADLAAARGSLSAAQGSRKQLRVIDRQKMVLARQLDEIKAEVKRQDIDIGNRTIISPADGAVLMTFVRAGEHVSEGQRILMFHDTSKVWVDANVKETDIAHLKLGMAADIRVDAFPGEVFKGKVLRIGKAATNKFALLPSPNPSGNFTKITQRLPVRFQVDAGSRALRPGMMVEVDVDIREH